MDKKESYILKYTDGKEEFVELTEAELDQEVDSNKRLSRVLDSNRKLVVITEHRNERELV